MKPIQNQYQDLLEGKMFKHNFLNNVKNALPEYVSKGNSYEDAISILKSKRIIFENNVTSQQIQDKYNEMFGKNSQTTFTDVAKALGISEPEIAAALFISPFKENKVDTQYQDPNTLAKAIASKYPELQKLALEDKKMFEEAAFKYAVELMKSAGLSSTVRTNLINGYADEDWPSDFISALGNILKSSEYDQEIINRYDREQEKHALPGGHTLENKNSFDKVLNRLSEGTATLNKFTNEIDTVNPIEYRNGVSYEVDLGGDFSGEGLQNAVKKVLKNLKKDPIYYTNLKAEATKKINNKKVVSSEYTELKKDNQVDKLNQLKSIVKKEIANTKTSLSKQEKASKAMPKGVKLMKEDKENNTELSAANVDKIIKNAGGPRADVFNVEDLKDGNVYVRSKVSGIYSLVGDALRTLESHFDVEERYEDHGERDEYEYFISPKTSKPEPENKPVRKPLPNDNIPIEDIFENDDKARQEKDFSDFSKKMIGKKTTAQNTIKTKIKEYVVKHLKKEAVKFTIGTSGDKEYMPDTGARAYEDKLKAAGVKFTKTKV
jgi:hypothetical protein